MLVFPEGRKGTEKLYKDRYRLRRFGRGGFVESAMRAKAPIVPVAVVGAEEAMPVFGHIGLARRLTGLIYFPITPTFPLLGPLRRPRLPAREVQDPLPGAHPDRPVGREPARGQGPGADRGRGGPRAGSRRSCTRWSPARNSGVARMSTARPDHRPLQLLGRPPGPGARETTTPSRRSSASRPRTRPASSHRTEYVRVGTQHALLRRIVHAAEIDTVVDTRLVVDSATAPPRVAHEQNVIGTMNILTACGGPNSPVKKVVFKSSAHYYGCERDDPSFFTETMRRPHEPRTRLESDIVEADDAVQGFAERNPDVTVTTLRFCNGLGPDLQHQPQRAAEPARGPRHPRLRPALPVHPRGRHRRRAPPRGDQRPPGHLQRRAGRRARAVRGREPARQAVRADPAAVGHRARGQGDGRRSAFGFPDEVLQQLRYGRGLDNRALKQSGYRFGLTTREAVQAFAEALRLAPLRDNGEAPYRYEREVEEFLRYSPSVRRDESST